MQSVDKNPVAIRLRAPTRFTGLQILLSFSVLDGLASWLLVLLYLTGIDLVWLVNVNLAAMSMVLILFAFQKFRVTLLTLLLGATLVASIAKFGLYLDDTRIFQWVHFLTYFQGLILPIAALCFASQFSREDSAKVLEILTCYAHVFFWLALPGMLTYSALYFLGYISYFGLGANLFYIYPFLAAKSPVLYTAVFFLIALVTGKRTSFLTVFLQAFLFHYSLFRRNKVRTFLLSGILVAATFLIYENTNLLSRFSRIFEVEFDLSDPYFLSISGGGRFEEIFGIYEYFLKHPFDVLFGAPPGSYYIWALEWSDYTATKNYSHMTWAGYLFRYGLFFTVPLITCFFYLIFRNLGSTNPLFVAFSGIFIASFFGALLIVDPTSWILIALFLYLGTSKKIAPSRQTIKIEVLGGMKMT